MFVLYLRKVSLIKYIRHKNIQIGCGEPSYKKVACLHDIRLPVLLELKIGQSYCNY